jgi:hypothetical protein
MKRRDKMNFDEYEHYIKDDDRDKGVKATYLHYKRKTYRQAYIDMFEKNIMSEVPEDFCDRAWDNKLPWKEWEKAEKEQEKIDKEMSDELAETMKQTGKNFI